MTEPRRCPKCGTELPADTAGPLCARCLGEHGPGTIASTPRAASEPTLAPRTTSPQRSGAPVEHRYFGDYEILEEIARGGMGVVYKARQTNLDRTVALKTILAGQTASECDVERFYTEARAAANLQHPNIVAIHEFGEHDGQLYFTMDYVEGQSLASMVASGPLPVEKAVTYLRAIADAIHYAHQHGILHRDLKPSNILIDRFDQPRVTDFGIAKRIGSQEIAGGDCAPSSSSSKPGLTTAGEVLGTPSYMSPEQIDADPSELGSPCDVYALGAVLYELLTGRPPFQANTARDTMLKVLQAPPPSIRRLNRRVPRALELICLKCLEKDPHRRYRSASALADDLSRFELGQETLAGATEKALMPRIVLGSALACLLFCCGGPLLFFSWWIPKKHTDRPNSLVQRLGNTFETIRSNVQNNIELQELAAAWHPPANESKAGALFPPSVGAFTLSGQEKNVMLPEFRLDQPSLKATYKSPQATIDLFVFHVNRKETRRILERVGSAFNDAPLRVTADTSVHYSYKFAGKQRTGSFIWTADRLLLARTSDDANTDEFLKTYFKATGPAQPTTVAAAVPQKSLADLIREGAKEEDARTADESGDEGQSETAAKSSREKSGWLDFSTLFNVALIGVFCAGIWRVYAKAGLPGWGGLIPVYNLVLWMRLGGKPGWWAIWLFVPFLNLVIYTIVTFEVAKNFGKGVAYTLGLLLVPPVFYATLGLGSAQYNATLLRLRQRATTG
jgi:serine/threonine protein kinase